MEERSQSVQSIVVLVAAAGQAPLRTLPVEHEEESFALVGVGSEATIANRDVAVPIEQAIATALDGREIDVRVVPRQPYRIARANYPSPGRSAEWVAVPRSSAIAFRYRHTYHGRPRTERWMRESTLGGLLVFAAAMGFGTLAIFGKLAEAAGLSRPTLLFFRFLVGAAIVWAVLLGRGEAVRLDGRPLRATVVLGVIYALLTLAYFWGLSFLTASLTGIVFYTYPIYVFVLSVVVLDEPLTPPVVAALTLALAGVVLVVGVESATVDLRGVALVVTAAIAYAGYNVAGRVLTAATSPRVLTGYVLVAAVGTLTVRWVLAGATLPRTSTHWWIILGIGVLGTGIPLVFLYEGLGRLEATRVSIISTMEPVATVFLGVTILDETLAPSTVVGGVLVLTGVTLVQVTREQRQWLLSKVGLH